MTEPETEMITRFFQLAAEDFVSYKTALDTLAENDATEHATLVEAKEILNEHATILEEMAEEIRRLKEWTGCPNKNDPRGPAPGTLWQTVGVMRDLLLKIWRHLGLPEDDILPKGKGGVN